MEVTKMRRSKPLGPSEHLLIEKESVLQKNPLMIVYQEHPLNVRTPPACVRQTFLTQRAEGTLLCAQPFRNSSRF